MILRQNTRNSSLEDDRQNLGCSVVSAGAKWSWQKSIHFHHRSERDANLREKQSLLEAFAEPRSSAPSSFCHGASGSPYLDVCRGCSSVQRLVKRDFLPHPCIRSSRSVLDVHPIALSPCHPKLKCRKSIVTRAPRGTASPNEHR